MRFDDMRVTKHDAWGNEYLVLLDWEELCFPSASSIARLCDPRKGIGADGFVHGPPAAAVGVDAVMELYNADGTQAEMSGNGIRCLAQALLLEGWTQPPEVLIHATAGIRAVTVVGSPVEDPQGTTTHTLSADMGPVGVLGEAAEWAIGPSGLAVWATAGNPHLVVDVGEREVLPTIDLVALGQEVNAATPDGANVNLVAAGPDRGSLTVRTYERGVGLTQACGTGACASAVAAAGWGMLDAAAPRENAIDTTVTVHMPGGQGRVVLGETVQLIGPVTTVTGEAFEYSCS